MPFARSTPSFLGFRAERRGWIYWLKRRAASNPLGALTLELQRILESDRARHVVEVQRDGRKEAGDPGSDPPAQG